MVQVISLIIGAAVGFAAFAATFGIMLASAEDASLAAANGTTGSATGDTFLDLLPLLIGIGVGLVGIVIVEGLTGQKFL